MHKTEGGGLGSHDYVGRLLSAGAEKVGCWVEVSSAGRVVFELWVEGASAQKSFRAFRKKVTEDGLTRDRGKAREVKSRTFTRTAKSTGGGQKNANIKSADLTKRLSNGPTKKNANRQKKKGKTHASA